MAKRTQSQLRSIVTDNNASTCKLPDISSGDILAQDVREVLTDIVDSPLFEVTAADIPANAISQGKIASNAVTSGKLATGAVTAAKIQDGQVTEDKLDSDTANKLVSTPTRESWDALDIRTITGFSVSGQTLTITWTDAHGNSQHLDATLPSGGGGQPSTQTHNIWVAASADQTFTPTEIQAGNTIATGNQVDVPTFSGLQYVAIVIPATRNLTGIDSSQDMGQNQRGAFATSPATATVNSEAVKIYSSNQRLRGSIVSGATWTITTEAV